MNKNFLYLLVFKDEPIIKFGISKNDDFSRVKQLGFVYNLNLSKSYVVNSTSSSFIKKLESQIQTVYKTFSIADEYQVKYKGKDGYTELRNQEALELILDDIYHTQKKNWLGIEVINGICLGKNDILEIGDKPKPHKWQPDRLKEPEHLEEVIDIISNGEGITKLNFYDDKHFIIWGNYDVIQKLNKYLGRVRYPYNYLKISRSCDFKDDFKTNSYTYGTFPKLFDTTIIKYPNSANQLLEIRKRFIYTMLASPKLDTSLSWQELYQTMFD